MLSQPTAYLSSLIDADSSNAGARIKMQHGTTTLAFRYKGGCIVAVDSRATAGSYIGVFSSFRQSCSFSFLECNIADDAFLESGGLWH